MCLEPQLQEEKQNKRALKDKVTFKAPDHEIMSHTAAEISSCIKDKVRLVCLN